MKNYRYVARSKAIAARAIGDETMVMSATNSTLFTLDEVASVIWEAADGVTPLDQIVASKICSQYDVTPEAALQDAQALVEALAGHGILLLSDQPLAQPSPLGTEAL
jgi:Coenzyme PQQ synthesis protein D (PqqD)